MKRQILNYTFTPGGAGVGTVTFTDINPIKLESIALIVNVTDGIIIFNFADPAKTGLVATNVLTLTFSTTGMASGDALMIVYNDGDAAHGEVDVGAPTKVGMIASTHGANPTEVPALDRVNWLANRHGVPFVMAGHPNVLTREFTITDAKTDFELHQVSGVTLMITQIDAMVDNACSVDVGVRIGFSTSTLPSTSATGAALIVLSHPGMPLKIYESQVARQLAEVSWLR